VDIRSRAERDQHGLRSLPPRQRPLAIVKLDRMPDAIGLGGRAAVLSYPALGRIRPVDFERSLGSFEGRQQTQVMKRRADESVFAPILALLALEQQGAEQ